MNNLINRNNAMPFWLFTIGIMCALTLPTLIKDGMFMDAMLYTSVSHNMSHGIGNFWFPEFSLHNVAGMTSFHEQPPLVFGIQAVFFKVFGDSMYVERFYTFFTLIISAFLIHALWKNIFNASVQLQKCAWIAILLWIIIPVCFWSYSANMHENTMTIFTLCAVLFSYKAFFNNKKTYIYLFISGIAIFLASFSKGIPGLFPITAPTLFWLITKKINLKKAFLYSIILFIIPILIYSVILLFPECNESLSNYFIKRAMHRIGQTPTVDNRFYILGRLFIELLPSLFFVLLILFIAKIKKIYFDNTKNKIALYFIALGLTASAPLMLTMVQKGFYFVPSLPLFAIGLGIFIAPQIAHFIKYVNDSDTRYNIFRITGLTVFICAIVLTATSYGKTSRDADILHDVYLMGEKIPTKSIVSVPGELWNEWSLQCYLSRNYFISLDDNYTHEYCIVWKGFESDSLVKYNKVNLSTVKFDLLKMKH